MATCRSSISRRTTRRHTLSSCFLLLVLTVLAGCGDTVKVDESADNPHFSHLAGIAEIYLKCRSSSRGAPVNEATLKEFGSSELASMTLERFDATSFDELLTSNRDGAPIELTLSKSKMRLEGVRVIAHETVGRDGSRLVALESGGAELLTEEEFKALSK